MKSEFKNWILLVILALIWGSAYILIKKGLIIYTPAQVSSLRIVAATLIFIPFIFKHAKGLNKRQWTFVIISGVLGSYLPSFCFAMAETSINSSTAGILSSLTPSFTVLITVIFFGQKTTIYKVAGLVLGLTGAGFLVFLNKEGTIDYTNIYGLLIILACIMYAVNLNFLKYPSLKKRGKSLSFFIKV